MQIATAALFTLKLPKDTNIEAARALMVLSLSIHQSKMAFEDWLLCGFRGLICAVADHGLSGEVLLNSECSWLWYKLFWFCIRTVACFEYFFTVVISPKVNLSERQTGRNFLWKTSPSLSKFLRCFTAGFWCFWFGDFCCFFRDCCEQTSELRSFVEFKRRCAESTATSPVICGWHWHGNNVGNSNIWLIDLRYLSTHTHTYTHTYTRWESVLFKTLVFVLSTSRCTTKHSLIPPLFCFDASVSAQ